MYSKLLPHIKTVLIISLAVLSVFLTAQLWFVNITNRNFFPYLQARFAPTAPDGINDLVRPFRIISGAGDGFFAINYSNIAQLEAWHYGKAIIPSLLQNGSFVGVTLTDMSDILNAPVIIYEYAFHMDATIFAEAFEHRTGTIISDWGIQSFRGIAIHPPHGDINTLSAFFISDESIWEFSLTPAPPITIPTAEDLPLHFVQTENTLDFLPRVHRNFSYNPVLAINPYSNHGLSLAFIRSQVEHFFDNPGTINHGLSGSGIYTFSNLTTVVRYLPGHVIEYTNFRTLGHTSSAGFVGDFSAALTFITNDPNVTNEIYLAGYDNMGRENIFWFNYVMNDFPLVLTSPWFTSAHCTSPLLHPIEVAVENGRVTRYRKIAYHFEIDTSVTARLSSALTGEYTLAFPITRGPHIRLETLEAVESE